MNVRLRPGQRLGIGDRFKGYFRLDNGALWCHNQEELDSQKGIFADFIQRASRKVLEGGSILSVSLPVRIFEKRTLVERMCDYFCTGPIYLRRAALEQDPVERFKAVIAFVVSGLHVAAS